VLVLTKVLLIVLPVCAVVLSPVTLEFAAASHVCVEGIFDVSANDNAVPLQTVVVVALVIDGFGLTVTVTV
jgi:hypothetical protein